MKKAFNVISRLAGPALAAGLSRSARDNCDGLLASGSPTDQAAFTSRRDRPEQCIAGHVARLICILFVALGFRSAAAKSIDFEREVWPIFEAHCLECHGPKKQKSSLRVDSRAALLKGGDVAPAIVPGKPDESYLLEVLLDEDEDARMPQDAEPLPPQQIATLRQWIVEGAEWPAGVTPEVAVVKHWAFEPVARPPIPEVESESPASKNPIDAFLAAKLAEHGLQFSAPTDPRTFIRRVTLDITGLPPTPEEAEAFVRECAENPDTHATRLPSAAVARLVERLLASPRYGERWAQHWLDVIRYADTTGYEHNSIRPNAWPYRDYVIAAFNADTPYPQFIAEQLAGDLLGVDPATGFLVTPPFPSRTEVGQEAASIAQARFNGLDEVLQNLGSAVLGVTVSCARCHDHKFDPVSARDYYRLAATFAGLQFVSRRWEGGAVPTERLGAVNRELDELRNELSAFGAWREAEPTRATDRFPPVRAKYVRLTVMDTDRDRKSSPAFDEIEVWSAPTKGAPAKNIGAAAQGAVARSSGADESLGSKDAFLNDGRGGWTSQWIGAKADVDGKRFNVGDIWVEIELPEPTVIDRVTWSCDYNDQGTDMLPLQWRFVTNWTLEVAEEPGQWRVVMPEKRDDIAEPGRKRRKELEEKFAVAAKRRRELANVFGGSFRSPPDPIHVLVRDDPQQKRDLTGPGGLDVLGGYELSPDTADPERRMALAQWLGSEKHPLTARVIVNRVWRHHFGAGIVDTPSDFGTQGERPTHPELLDWLASEFMARGWRLKELHRLICTSAAYAQSSAPVAAAEKIDTDARLLWRFPPRRLEAEAIRDSMLFASGSLDLTMGGPGVNIYQPRAKPNFGEWLPQENPGPESWRRAIYLLRIRGGDDGVFKPFDVPDCGQVRAKRSQSTTPLQALNLFNSPFIIEQAQRLAERAQRDSGNDPSAQIARIFALMLARPPTPAELAASLDTAQTHGLATVCRALINTNEFLFLE